MIWFRRGEVGESPLFFGLLFPRTIPIRHGAVGVHDLGSRVHHIAEPIALALGLDVVAVECHGKGVNTIVRVIVDKEGGVGIAECEQCHHSLSRALDVADPIPHSYRLEVSSPGLDRPLKQRKDYQRAVGRTIRVKVLHPINGNWTFIGRLTGITEHGLTLQIQPRQSRTDGRMDIQWDAIAQAKREIEW